MSDPIRYRRTPTGHRARVVTHDGVEGFVVRHTAPCTGCYEGGENSGSSGLYPYDAKAGCRVGVGCHECGHTGKRRHEDWVPFELAEQPRSVP